MILTSEDSLLLHAAAGMDFLLPLSPSGDLFTVPTEATMRMLVVGYLEEVSFCTYKITPDGVEALNKHIGLKYSPKEESLQ